MQEKEKIHALKNMEEPKKYHLHNTRNSTRGGGGSSYTLLVVGGNLDGGFPLLLCVRGLCVIFVVVVAVWLERQCQQVAYLLD